MIFSKTNHALASKALYQKLEKRYGLVYQNGDIARSRRSWDFQGDLATHHAFAKALRKCRSVVFGDHRLRLGHSAQMISWLEEKKTSLNHAVWITNRFDPAEQKMIQQWLDDMVSDQVLLEQIERPPQPLTKDPQPLLWAWLYWVKKNKIPVIWITPKGSLGTQANAFFRRCLKEHQQGRHVIGWTGYLPMAPCWSDQLPSDLLRVVLEQPSTHWKHQGTKNKPWLAKQSLWVRLDNAPILSLECARLFQNNQQWYLPADGLEDWVQKLWAHFEKEFKVPMPNTPIRIWHPFGQKFSLSKTITNDGPLKRFVEKRMANGENVVLPKAKWIIMMQLQAELVAEEAMHAFRLFNMPQKEYGPWVTVWEEAWGMFASLWVDADRVIPEPTSNDVWTQVHVHGYHLGVAMFDLYHSSSTAKKKVRAMFLQKTTDEQTAKEFVRAAQTWVGGQS